MPQIKLYLPEGGDEARKRELIRKIGSAVVHAWVFRTSSAKYGSARRRCGTGRSIPTGTVVLRSWRSPSMPLRHRELKQRLMAGIVSLIHELLGIDPREINCCIYEVASENYYGVSHSYIEELKLG